MLLEAKIVEELKSCTFEIANELLEEIDVDNKYTLLRKDYSFCQETGIEDSWDRTAKFSESKIDDELEKLAIEINDELCFISSENIARAVQTYIDNLILKKISEIQENEKLFEKEDYVLFLGNVGRDSVTCWIYKNFWEIEDCGEKYTEIAKVEWNAKDKLLQVLDND